MLSVCAFAPIASCEARQSAVVYRTAGHDLATLLSKYRKRNPTSKSAEVARYANGLIARYGIAYEFDACRLAPRGFGQGAGGAKVKSIAAWSIDKSQVRVQFGALLTQGMCSECMLPVPLRYAPDDLLALVTDKGLLMIAKPKGFNVEPIQLMDRHLRRQLGQWGVPSQTHAPLGLSPDGKELFVPYAGDHELALGIRGKRLRLVPITNLTDIKVEPILNGPKDKRNEYHGFARVTVQGHNYFLRFSYPCT
jgi:hypothetical protein